MRYFFRQDDDGHWYMIPANKSVLFTQLLVTSLETDSPYEFIAEFDEYCINGSPMNFVFENPEEV